MSNKFYNYFEQHFDCFVPRFQVVKIHREDSYRAQDKYAEDEWHTINLNDPNVVVVTLINDEQLICVCSSLEQSNQLFSQLCEWLER